MGREFCTPEDENRVLTLVAEYGTNRKQVAESLGWTQCKLDGVIRRRLSDGRYEAAVDTHRKKLKGIREAQSVPSKLSDILDIPVRPFAVPIPIPPKPQEGKPLRAVVFGDTHYPFQDEAALKVVLGVIADVSPNIIVHLGDLVDCWQISRFDKDPSRFDSLQQNIDQARVLLHQVAQVAPQAQRVLLEGNHEHRLEKMLWQLQGRDREIVRLRKVNQVLNWPSLLDLQDIGWDFVPERDQSKRPVLPKIITKHGTVVRKYACYTARGEWEKYGASGISGHTHRAGVFTHRDHNGSAVWIEAGCTCDLEPSYGTDFDWQQACVVLDWSADRYVMEEHIVRIRDGRAIWRSRELVA